MSPRAMQVLTILCAVLAASASATQCPRPCKCYTDHNGIRAANCTDLPVPTKTAWPLRILRIRLADDRATGTAAAPPPPPVVLRNKAFSHLPRLTYLDITGRAVQHVAAKAFDGLPELVELNMAGTGVRKLDRHAFAANRKLAFLSLRNNPGLIVSTSFLASESITELDVSACGLLALKSVYFSGLPNLKYLFAANNRLVTLGSQFAPPGVKYVNLAGNRIGNIDDDLEAYKRLRTIDLTGNPVNCTCELSEMDRRLTARGVAFGNTVTCANTGVPLDDMAETCSDKEMLGDDPESAILKTDELLKVDKSALPATDEDNEDGGSGSGSGDGEGVRIVDTSEENVSANDNGATTSSERPETTSSETFVSQETGPEEPSPGETTSSETTPGETTSSETTAVETTSSETTAVETTSGETTSGENTSGETTSSEAPVTGSQETTDETSTAAMLPVDEPVFTKDSSQLDLVVNSANPTTTTTTTAAAAAVDHNIVSNPIQLPKDEDEETTTVMAAVDYLKSNVVVTGTAAILAVVLMALVYKAVCAGKSRGRRAVDVDGKTVELKEIKYMAADTEDSRRRDEDDRDESGATTPPSSSAEENLLDDRGDDTDDTDNSDDDGDSNDVGAPPTATANGGPANGGVVDAPGGNGAANVPTRVIVKLGETPKASKPITIDNVH